jgi:hypothetical protein
MILIKICQNHVSTLEFSMYRGIGTDYIYFNVVAFATHSILNEMC